MDSRVRVLILIGCTALAFLGPGARASNAQEAEAVIGSYFPTQLVPGETNVLHLATPARNPAQNIQSIEIIPSTGIMVTGMTQRNLGQGALWSAFTVVVAKDAAPGPRMLVAVLPMGKSAPVTITIPNHVPAISDLKVLPAQGNKPMVDLQVAAADQGGAFESTPYVWFVLGCGSGQPRFGVVRGVFAGGAIKASIPSPRSLGGWVGNPAAGDHCNLELRVSDSTRVDSNTLKATVDFR
jgi:hypothetical protein